MNAPSPTPIRTTAFATAVVALVGSACPLPGDTDTAFGTTSPSVGSSTVSSTDGGSESGAPPATTGPVLTTTGGSTGVDDASMPSTASGETSSESSGGDTSTGETAGCDPQPGEAMGPCRLAVDPKGPCDGDLLCLTGPQGNFCQPTCADCFAGTHDACVDALSDVPPAGRFECFAGEGCSLACFDDDDCADPLVCDEVQTRSGPIHVCVWPQGGGVAPPQCEPFAPSSEAGLAGGPCLAGNLCGDGLACHVGAVGAGVCVTPGCEPPPCTVAIGCADVAPGMMCDPTAGWRCVWPASSP